MFTMIFQLNLSLLNKLYKFCDLGYNKISNIPNDIINLKEIKYLYAL